MSASIQPALLFPKGAEEAVAFYRSVFPDFELMHEEQNPDGSHLASSVRIQGTEFLFISGGPACEFSMATSFMILCDTQDEIDSYWRALGEGGQEHACGWISDRFGMVWQVVPRQYDHWMRTGTPEQRQAAFQKLISMVKLEIAPIEAAWRAAAPGA